MKNSFVLALVALMAISGFALPQRDSKRNLFDLAAVKNYLVKKAGTAGTHNNEDFNKIELQKYKSLGECIDAFNIGAEQIIEALTTAENYHALADQLADVYARVSAEIIGIVVDAEFQLSSDDPLERTAQIVNKQFEHFLAAFKMWEGDALLIIINDAPTYVLTVAFIVSNAEYSFNNAFGSIYQLIAPYLPPPPE